MIRPRHVLPAALAAAALLAGCSSPAPAAPASTTVTVTNCEAPAEFPAPATKVFVNDGNLISMMLALGAQDSIVAVSSLQRDAATLSRHYGAGPVDGLKQVAPEYPSLETVLAQSPDVMVAGWNYGYSETKNITPAGLRERGIAPYVLTESCRQQDGQKARGIVDPWTALRDDLTNLGAITGKSEQAAAVNADIEARLAALRSAPQPATPPTVFLYDSGTDAVYSSGRFGAPEGILTAAGARNALADVEDTWTEVSWERVAASNPAAFLFVDYPPQTFAQKTEVLRSRAGIRDLPAVQQGRFLNLPYAMWTSGPLNVDAAEQIRKALEGWQLVPASGITPKFDDAVR
ncbi:ABC transporter substrate-binding protein [Pseudonocardia sulfidoxydans NBRC 16205]|uniref:ABC transporter substrate-binding protein n=1 Tax=Pseudonocardia sulfidoxydans NBRC 16205 TaxID=1223511 RepID=A0A511DBH4_9PSEU|nr:ABC transporter substrate-binding protein [Pseudonocardia sulfidoxydans]GEL21743.1 ABC transporter substrate-binding protein [Pseudonocardia sulfidoxydans NBRC 16205]